MDSNISRSNLHFQPENEKKVILKVTIYAKNLARNSSGEI